MLWFACGLMSKPILVTTPFLFLLLDFWPLRRFSEATRTWKIAGRLLIEKTPFFVLSAASSVVTFIAQRSGGAIDPLQTLPSTRGSRMPSSLTAAISESFFGLMILLLLSASNLGWVAVIPGGLVDLYRRRDIACGGYCSQPLSNGLCWLVLVRRNTRAGYRCCSGGRSVDGRSLYLCSRRRNFYLDNVEHCRTCAALAPSPRHYICRGDGGFRCPVRYLPFGN